MDQVKDKSGEPLVRDQRGQSGKGITLQPLLGTWLNTNSRTRGITKVVLASSGERLYFRVFGAYEPSTYDWGEVTASVFAEDTQATEAMAFNAAYEFDFMKTSLHGFLRQGVLVVAKFDSFRDSSGRSSYFTKEFFYRSGA